MPRTIMNSYQDIMKMMEESRGAAKKRIESNKQILFDVFDMKGVIGAEVNFDGSGDSGGIEDIQLYKKGKKGESEDYGDSAKLLEMPVVGAKIYSGMSFGPNGAYDLFEEGPTNVKDLIEGICYDALKSEHEGWENNDGAYGNVRLDSFSRKVMLEFYRRSTEYFEHDF